MEKTIMQGIGPVVNEWSERSANLSMVSKQFPSANACETMLLISQFMNMYLIQRMKMFYGMH